MLQQIKVEFSLFIIKHQNVIYIISLCFVFTNLNIKKVSKTTRRQRNIMKFKKSTISSRRIKKHFIQIFNIVLRKIT